MVVFYHLFADFSLSGCVFFFFQAEDGIRDYKVTGVQTCALPISFDVAEDSLVPYGYRPTGRGTCTLFRGRGCPTCNFTGLKGRVAIYEIMPMSSTMRDLIAKAPSIDEIRRAALEHGMQTLREAALQKVVEGVTTLDEILRVISE